MQVATQSGDRGQSQQTQVKERKKVQCYKVKIEVMLTRSTPQVLLKYTKKKILHEKSSPLHDKTEISITQPSNKFSS